MSETQFHEANRASEILAKIGRGADPTVTQNGPRITKEHIDSLLAESLWSDTKLGAKTTVVCLTLPNGFEVIESSGCVDPANYDHKLGVETCRRRIVDKVWMLEGYRLATDLHRVASVAASYRREPTEHPAAVAKGI